MKAALLLIVVILSALLAGVGVLITTGDLRLSLGKVDEKAAIADSTGRPKNVFDEHLAKAGIANCDDVFSGLGNEMTLGSTFDAVTDWNVESPDDKVIHSAVGMDFGARDARIRSVGFLFAHSTPTSCAGDFVRVLPLEMSCEAFAKARPSAARQRPAVDGLTYFTLPNGWSSVLLPSPNGCTVVTMGIGKQG